jgi:hypothetical protein
MALVYERGLTGERHEKRILTPLLEIGKVLESLSTVFAYVGNLQTNN